MSKHTLKPFDNKAYPFQIQSELNLTNESVFISYKVTGDLSSIDLGDGHPVRSRVIKLWEKTCFELFLKTSTGAYMEFNFSPVFEWNAFYFEKKGDALAEYKGIQGVKTDILLSDEVFHLIVEIAKSDFPEGFFKGSLEGQITSVIKEDHNHLSYWALNHTDSKPNFHDFRSFTQIN